MCVIFSFRAKQERINFILLHIQLDSSFFHSFIPKYIYIYIYVCVTFSHCNLESVVDKYIVKKLNHVFHVKMFVVTFCFTQGNYYPRTTPSHTQ